MHAVVLLTLIPAFEFICCSIFLFKKCLFLAPFGPIPDLQVILRIVLRELRGGRTVLAVTREGAFISKAGFFGLLIYFI